MARKLKFDRLLFLTTLVLVAVSIVMVYSASNLMGAGSQPGRTRSCEAGACLRPSA